MELWKEEKEHWYATKTLVKQITEGKCLICGKKLEEREIEEVLKEERYKEAGKCKKCLEKEV